MRDEHLDFGHLEANTQAKLFPSNLDMDEIQPLFFDLIRLDKVEAVNSIMHYFDKLEDIVQTELQDLVALSGSASMVQVLYNRRGGGEYERCTEYFRFLANSIKGMNFETLRWLLSRTDNLIKEEISKSVDYQMNILRRRVLVNLFESESLEIFQECEKFLIDILRLPQKGERAREKGRRASIHLSVSSHVIKATAGYLVRENLLLSFWAACGMGDATSKFNSQQNLSSALINVAKTTCSLVLAKPLLEYGAKVNIEITGNFVTALEYAARQSSPQAAELMKFLLYHGADPELQAGNSKLKISEGKGAKEIAKWLGMSWDELVQKIKLDREKGICPPEYT